MSALKSGYLVKCAKESARNWRRRFFVLNGNTLSYYMDHKTLNSVKGDILLVSDSVVRDEVCEDYEYSFRVVTPFESLLLAARTREERDAWKGMIQAAIEYSQCSLRGYMLKRTKGFLASSVRKFFVFHGGLLTYHQDHEHTATIQYQMKINAETKLVCNDAKLKLFLYEPKVTEPLIIQFDERNANDYFTWRDALSTNIQKFQEALKEDNKANETVLKNAILASPLGHRPTKGGDQWPLYNSALTNNEFIVLEKVGSTITNGVQKITERYLLHPDCCVRETKLKEFAFELVTSKMIIHVCATSKPEMDTWISAIKDVISKSEIDRNETLLRAAIEKIAYDVFYEVCIEEYKPLGINLDKAAEWAMVKKSIFADTGVKVGSALHAINGDVVMFQKYDNVMKHLRGWVTGALLPPLTLCFRMAPEKTGYLMKKSTVANVPTWKARYCVLGEGRFTLKESEDIHAKIRGEIPLNGASISLMSTQETGKYFCFRILVGVYELILQAADLKDVMDWAATIYHAIAIANGGGHIIPYENARIRAEEERLAALKHQKIEEENRHVVEMISRAIEFNDISGLKKALEIAHQLGIVGELIDYANERLRQMLEDEESMQIHDNQFESEMLTEDPSLGEMVGADFSDMMSHDISDAGYEGAADTGEDEHDPNSATVSREAMRRLSLKQTNVRNIGQTNALNANISGLSVEDDDYDEMMALALAGGYSGAQYGMDEAAIEESIYANIDPASDGELRKLFRFFVKADIEQINVMQFCTIWRLVTGEKGNLHKEMQMFHRFDKDNSAAVNEDEFVAGWINYTTEIQDDTLLRRVKQLVSGDQICF